MNVASYVGINLAFIFALISGEVATPTGHGSPLGAHRPSDGHIDVLSAIPDPETFWATYAKHRRPVLFRGAAKSFPAFELWTDSYLDHHYGDLQVKLEAKMEKNHTPTGKMGLGRDTIRSFLNVYRRKDTYIVSQLPDPMAREVHVLPCLSCGSFRDHILEANLWLSSGGTASLLHRDADNAFNCLLNGTKDWILIDPKYEENIPIAEGDSGFGGFALLDINRVNLLKYPRFERVPWNHANVTAGDCLFLPYGYWHQVRSYGSKNMAVSVLFSRLQEFNSSNCKGNYEAIPLSNVDMVWTYSGFGLQTLGNTDPFEFRGHLIEIVKYIEQEGEKVSLLTLMEALSQTDMLEEFDDESSRKNVAKIFQTLSNYTNGDINENSIKKLTTQQLKTIIIQLENHAPNSDDYEYAVFSPSEISEIIQNAMDADKGRMKESTLTEQHTLRQGSERVAREIFQKMDLNNDDVVTKAEMDTSLHHVLDKFKPEIPNNNLSNENYLKELEKDREIMENVKDEL